MDAIDLARRILARIDRECVELSGTILSGTMPDHAAYRQSTGQRAGLLRGRAIVVELLGERKDELNLGV